jgi:hypothetical protein
MQIGIKSKKTLVLRHIFVAALSALMVYLFYLSYGAWGVEPALWPAWDQDHPLWRAFSHAAFVLLFLSLILGPAARLSRPVARFVSWRREFGIWFVVLSIGHGYVIWDRWARWDVAALFGFEYVPEMGSYILSRPEVGIMNMMMLIAAPMILLLVVTSSDRAVGFLGISSWKWLHSSLIHAIFYILVLRGILYFFFFFQASPPQWRIYPDIWFAYVFLGMALVVVLLQGAAFAKTVLQQRSYGQGSNVFQVAAVIGVALLFASPMALATGTIWYFDSRVVKEDPTRAGQMPPGQNYARTFHMVIHDTEQEIHLWARDLDSTPYFRQTVEVAGSPVSHQIYRSSDRTLYRAELDAGGGFDWTKLEDVSAEDIVLSRVGGEQGVWVAQLGVGEHDIQLPQGTLRVTIHGEDEAIDDGVFEIPSGADPVPITL